MTTQLKTKIKTIDKLIKEAKIEFENIIEDESIPLKDRVKLFRNVFMIGKKMIDLTCVDKGFRNRNAKWRIAYSSKPDVWYPTNDARCSEYFSLKNNGLAFVLYIRGSKKYVQNYINLIK